MYDLKTNLEPGNPEGHTVLRYLVEAKQMPLEVAIERVYHTVNKCAAEYRSDQKKLLTGIVVTGILGLPVFFPFGVSSLLIAGAIGASAFSWQEFGVMRDRLKPEYAALKGSVLLEQFIKWLAQELKERSGQAVTSGQFQPDALTTANILAAYEHTIFAVTVGEHLENNASDPILALFVAKLRQHTNQLPSWVMDAFRHLEQAENQRRAHLDAAYGYMFGNLANQSPSPQPQVGQNTRLKAVDVPAQPVDAEGEQRLGKPQTEISQPQILPAITSEEAGLKVLDAIATTRRSTLLIGDTGSGKSVTQAYVLTKLFELHPEAQVFVLSQKADSFCGLAEKGRVTLFDLTEPEDALALIYQIWNVYDTRRRLPESERQGLPPVRLILADWLSINQAFEELKNEESVKSSKYLTKLADIIYNGRELNVCLLVDLQSYNLAAVGLKADRNSRKNFNLIGLGNYSVDELGMVNESYGVLTNLIGDRYIVADESERTALTAAFKQLQPISKANQRPIIFCGLSPARLALLPDLRKFKDSTVSTLAKQPITLINTTDKSQQQSEAIALPESTTELKVSDSLSEPLKSIWLFAKKKSDWVTAKDVYNNGMSVLKGKGVKQIRQYFGLLADSGFGEIDEMDGNKPKSDSSVGFRAN
jgi:hypothetical protein